MFSHMQKAGLFMSRLNYYSQHMFYGEEKYQYPKHPMAGTVSPVIVNMSQVTNTNVVKLIYACIAEMHSSTQCCILHSILTIHMYDIIYKRGAKFKHVTS